MQIVDAATVLRRDGPLPLSLVVRIVTTAGDELRTAWTRRPTAHGIIKASNILLAESDDEALTVVGLAAFAGLEHDTPEPARTNITEVTSVPPEVLQGKGFDHLADEYCLAAVAFELLTGTRPFRGRTTAEILQAILDGLVPDPLDWNPHLPAALRPIFRTAMATAPAQRYASTAGFAAALRDAIENP
jgi:serine/threonine protein kinase